MRRMTRSSPSMDIKIDSMPANPSSRRVTLSPGLKVVKMQVCARICSCFTSCSLTGNGLPPKATTRATPRLERKGAQLAPVGMWIKR